MSTPRVVTDAFVPDANRLPGGLVLHPLSIAHTLLLQKIRSPFMAVDDEPAPPPSKRAAKGARKRREIPAAKPAPSELDTLAVVYILTRTEDEIDALFYGFDRAAFDRDVWKFAKTQSPALLVGLQDKLAAVFARATSTLIGGGNDDTPAPGDQKKMT